MPLELWESTPEEIRDRWRDIARALRRPDRPDALARALQTCFWYGAAAGAHPAGAKSEMTLRHLLPPEQLGDILRAAAPASR